VKQLLTSFTGSQFVASVETSISTTARMALLRFDFTLVVNPRRPL